jgi:hypothetical protein
VQRPVVAAPPPAVNLALNRPATGSTACASGEVPAKAVNGSVSGGLTDKFCSTASTTRYLEVDLGSNRTVSTFVVKHAGAGGESIWLNTRAYRIDLRTSSGSWSTALTVSGNAANVTTGTITPRQARYVRLVITASEQGTGAGAARIYDFEVYAGASAAVPADPLVAYSGLGATGRAQRFEAGQYGPARGNLGIIGDNAMRSVDVAPGFRATLCRSSGVIDCVTLPAGRHGTLPGGFDLSVSSLRVAPN